MVAVSGEAVFDRIEQTQKLISELEPILQSLMLNDSSIIDAMAQILATQQRMQHRLEEQIANLAADIRDLNANQLQMSEGTNSPLPGVLSFDGDDPEVSLLAHLLPTLPNSVLIDVGANIGRIAQNLVGAGYEVFAFEPFAPSFVQLVREAERSSQRLHGFPLAIGAEDRIVELLVATDGSGANKWDTSLFHSTVRHPMLADLTFSSGEPVEMRSLSSLARTGTIPGDAAVLKIDTEGADLDVITGAGDMRFAVVVSEFWDLRHPFGREGHGNLAALVEEMRARGYAWHIVIYRVDELNKLGWYFNARTSVPKSWGNVVFFRGFDVFREACAWCRSTFPVS